MSGQVRSTAEMRFAASLAPCPRCGAAPTRLDFRGSGTLWLLSGPCPGCAEVRVFPFASDVDPLRLPAPAPYELGGAAPSQVLPPARLAEELARLEAGAVDEPAALALAAWAPRLAEAERALTCAVELAKFPPEAQPPDLPARRARARARVDAFLADAPRTWALRAGGELHVSEEVRGLVNQAATARPVRAADLDAYLARRAAVVTRSVVTAARAWEDGDGAHAALELAPVALGEVAKGTGPLAPRGEGRSVAEQVVRGHRVTAEVEHAGGVASRVTLRFTPAG